MNRWSIVLVALCITGCRAPCSRHVTLQDHMIGREVVVTLKPQDVFVWCGPLMPPQMHEVRDGREVYRGILTGFDNRIISLRPLPKWPKTYPVNTDLWPDADPEERSGYATSVGIHRYKVQEIGVVR